jgi:hypothetical protein
MANSSMRHLDALKREMLAPLQARIAKHQLDSVVRSLSEAERKLLSMGDRLHIFMPDKKTKKMVRTGFFDPPIYIDTTYVDYEALNDPLQSDMPIMKHLEAMGLIAYKGSDLSYHGEHSGQEWSWTRTPFGKQVADHIAGKPDAPSFSIKWISENEAELIDLRQR